MKEHESKIGLFEVEKNFIFEFSRKFKILFPLMLLSILVSFTENFVYKQMTGDAVYIMAALFLFAGSYILFFYTKTIIDIKIEKTQILKIIVKTLIAIILYTFGSVFFILFTKIPSIVREIAKIALDFYLVKAFYEALIKEKFYNTKEDNKFLIKYGIEYYFLRYFLILLFSLFVKEILQITNSAMEVKDIVNVIYNLIRLVLLPLVAFYFEYKKVEKDSFE